MDERKRIGLKFMIGMGIATAMCGYYKRLKWAPLKTRRDSARKMSHGHPAFMNHVPLHLHKVVDRLPSSGPRRSLSSRVLLILLQALTETLPRVAHQAKTEQHLYT